MIISKEKIGFCSNTTNPRFRKMFWAPVLESILRAEQTNEQSLISDGSQIVMEPKNKYPLKHNDMYTIGQKQIWQQVTQTPISNGLKRKEYICLPL